MGITYLEEHIKNLAYENEEKNKVIHGLQKGKKNQKTILKTLSYMKNDNLTLQGIIELE